MRYVLYVCGTLLVTALATMIIVGCSPDTEENEGTEEILTETVEEVIEPEPEWANGTITITVGRFETRQQMLDKMGESFSIAPRVERNIIDERRTLTPLSEQYTVDVVILSMKEVGIHSKWGPNADIERIEKQFRNRGYRPLTPEEAMELRLQLPDQPDSSTQHKMSAFLALPSKETHLLNVERIKFAYGIVSAAYKEDHHHMVKNTTGYDDGAVRTMIIRWLTMRKRDHIFDPNEKDPLGILSRSMHIIDATLPLEVDFGEPPETHPGPRFAAAVVGSERRK